MAMYDPQRDQQEDPIARKRRQVIVSSLNTGPAPVTQAGPSYPAPQTDIPDTGRGWGDYDPYRQDPKSPGYVQPGTGANLPPPEVKQAPPAIPTAQQSPIVNWFSQWYGRPPSAAEFADFDRQSQLFPGAMENVLQNLYRNSPSYNAQTPQYRQWQPMAAAVATLAPPSGGGSPLEGFDLTRAQDTSASAKDAFAAATQKAPPAPTGDKAALATWFNQYIKPQMEALGHRINWVQGDKMNFTSPQGTFTVDFARGAGAPGGALAWQVDDGQGGGAAARSAIPAAIPTAGAGVPAVAAPTARPTPTAPTAPPPATALPAVAAAPSVSPQQSAFSDSVRQQILKLLGMDLSNLDQNPAIQAQSQAYARSQQRAGEQARASIAERLNAQGLGGTGGGGALDTQLERLRQTQGEQAGAFNANLLGNEVANIRNMGLQALQTGAGVMTADQENALREWLANLQNQQFGQQLGQQNQQFYAGLGQNANQFGQDLGYRYAALGQNANQFGQDLGYRYSALDSGNQNFLDQLGYNYTQLQQQANRDALLAALGR